MQEKKVKMALFLFVFRLPVYQMVIVTLQSASIPCIVMCLGVELALIGLHLYMLWHLNAFWTRVKTISKLI